MKKVHRIDSNSLYIEDVILQDNDSVPPDCVEVPLPEGIFLPAKFQNGVWETTLTQDEINAKMNTVPPPSELETLKKNQTDLLFNLMIKGVL